MISRYRIMKPLSHEETPLELTVNHTLYYTLHMFTGETQKKPVSLMKIVPKASSFVKK
jgi:hypothetical protein